MVHKAPNINLAKNRKVSNVDKIINWAFSAGRIIIIVTEGIALCAFLYRFTLDSQIVDLHSKIKQKQAIITLYKDNEQTYRQLQEQLSRLTALAPQGKKSVEIFRAVLEATPPEAIIDNVSYSANSIKLQMGFFSKSTIGQFVNSIQKIPDVDKVSLDSIENKSSTAVINVGITISLKKSLVSS